MATPLPTPPPTKGRSRPSSTGYGGREPAAFAATVVPFMARYGNAHRCGRSRSGEGEPLRHCAGDAELAVPHRILDDRARVAGRLLRPDERQGRGGGAARRVAA